MILAAIALHVVDDASDAMREMTRQHGAVFAGACAGLGALLAAGVAGWRVLGGWRGAARAILVVAIAGAAGFGTYHSPVIVESRGHSLLSAVGAGLFAAAFGALALLRTQPAPPGDLPERAPPAP